MQPPGSTYSSNSANPALTAVLRAASLELQAAMCKKFSPCAGLPVVHQYPGYSHAPFSIGAAWRCLIINICHHSEFLFRKHFPCTVKRCFIFSAASPNSLSFPLLFGRHNQPGPSFSLNHTHMILKIDNFLEIMSNWTMQNPLSNSAVPDHTLYPNYPTVKIPIHQRSSW